MSELSIFHEGEHNDEAVLTGLPIEFSTITYFQKNRGKEMIFAIEPNGEKFRLSASYFIGHGWILQNTHAIYIQPKLNKTAPQTDYVSMLFTALAQPDSKKSTKELFIINWDEPLIRVKQENDLLTPLLIAQFLRHVQVIVRKGLKKSYYRITSNLNGRIKGKILVGENIKQNLVKSRVLRQTCT
ncbi:MAG: hypothetical protein PHX54_09700, partial [Lentimicrobiaceae bacterium]|nr:hypothetical protein [Lentimicrobiaceae bacterium]